MHREFHKFLAHSALAVPLLCIMLAACGSDQPEGKTTFAGGGAAAAATVGMDACTACHAAQTADWLTSSHANVSPDLGLNSSGSPTVGAAQDAACRDCHDPLGDSARLTPGRTGNAARPVVGCESCHGGGSEHKGTGPIARNGYAAATTGRSSQFNTCTTCHELLDSAGTGLAPTGAANIITDTHFAQPRATTGLFGISGYAMDYTSESVCTHCHNPHGQHININTEWAQSGHADRYRSGQDPQGYFNAAWGRFDWNSSDRARCQRCHSTTGFVKYVTALRDGDQATVEGIIEGAITSLSTATPYKPEMLHCNGCHVDNKGGLRNPGPVTAQYDVLMSYPTSTYPLATFAEVHYTYPDVGASNICLACHVGLESGDSIKQLNSQADMSPVDFNSMAFRSSHYLTAGSAVFSASGYDFSGRSYASPSSYMHDRIGRADFRGTGFNGPCVGCHMSRPNGNGNHLFLPIGRFNRVVTNAGTVTLLSNSATVTGSSTAWSVPPISTTSDAFVGPDGRTYGIASVDNATQITLTTAYTGTGSTQTGANRNYVIAREGERVAGIASELCFNCHAGTTTALVGQLNEGREVFRAALRALEHALDRKGYGYFDGNIQRLRYRSGTVSVTKGSPVVTGVGTAFTSAGISSGIASTSTDKFRIYDGEAYDILRVDSGTQITLKSPFLGESGAGLSYAIFRVGSANRITDWTDADDDATGAASGKNNMGAAYNLNLFEHDPGAYVHNRMYVKRLVYDSIDWVDDGQMNYSVGATLNAVGPEPYKTQAIHYLLPNGALGIAAERP